MKITLSERDCRNDVFLGILQHMINSRMPYTVTMTLLSLAKLVNDHRTHSNVIYNQLFEDHSELVKEEGKPDFRRIKADQAEAFQTKLNAFMSEKFETRLNQIEPNLLTNLNLSVNELLAIAPLLIGGDDLTVMEQPPKPPLAAVPPEATL